MPSLPAIDLSVLFDKPRQKQWAQFASGTVIPLLEHFIVGRVKAKRARIATDIILVELAAADLLPLSGQDRKRRVLVNARNRDAVCRKIKFEYLGALVETIHAWWAKP